MLGAADKHPEAQAEESTAKRQDLGQLRCLSLAGPNSADLRARECHAHPPLPHDPIRSTGSSLLAVASGRPRGRGSHFDRQLSVRGAHGCAPQLHRAHLHQRICATDSSTAILVSVSSMLRNSAKSNGLLRDLGWVVRPPGDGKEWDGLMSWFVSEVAADPSLLRIVSFGNGQPRPRTPLRLGRSNRMSLSPHPQRTCPGLGYTSECKHVRGIRKTALAA